MTPILLRVVPRELLGRTVGAVSPIQSLAGMISVLVAGWLVSTVLVDFHATVAGQSLGRVDAVYLAAGLLTALGGLYAVGLRKTVSEPRPAAQPEPAPEPV